MANNTGDRGFNNIHNSAVAKREKNRNLQKYTILGVIVLAALTVFMLLVLAIGGIVANIRNGSGQGPDNEKVEWSSFTVTATDTLHGDLVLVNNAHVYTFPDTEEHLREIYATYATHKPDYPYVLSGLSKSMDADALTALDTMLTDFAAASGKKNVLVKYAYRDYQEQESFSTPAGYSDHHTGLGVELGYTQDKRNYNLSPDNAEYAWLYQNCHKYGFVVRYPADKSDKTGVEDYTNYFRYVGVAHATYMAENGLCLEEYIETVKGYTHDKPLKVNGADGRFYEVYYVAVDGSATVKYPTNYAYTVSGTNDGGVVITVDRSQALKTEETGDADTSASTSAGN